MNQPGGGRDNSKLLRAEEATMTEEKRLASPSECMHWKDGARDEEECFAPAKWYAHVAWGELWLSVCDAHKEQIEREDVEREPDVAARWRFEPIVETPVV